MNPAEYELLLAVLSIETYSMQEDQLIAYLLEFFAQHDIKAWRDDMGNVYAEKGQPKSHQKYPLVVAHTDTVHKIHGRGIVPKKMMLPNFAGKLKPALKGFDLQGNPVGMGADCKLGVALSLILFLREPILKGFFPVQEELGAKGAAHFDPDFMQDVGYGIEFDSPSNIASLVVGNTLLFNPEDEKGLGKIWTEILLSFSENKGTSFSLARHPYTDIIKLRHLFSCCNVPVGYYLYHSRSEYLIEEEACWALEMGEALIGQLGYRHYLDDPHPSPQRLMTQFEMYMMEINGEL